MSEPESFVSRWARLKREAAQAPAEEDPAPEQTRAPQAAAPAPESAEPAVDLSALPPLESITAATDIRAYLAPGVPPDLTRAALRRAWVADPTIRDFVGIAENQWDFNDPNGVPGFGPLDEAGRALARMLFAGESPSPPSDTAPLGENAVNRPQNEGSPASSPPIGDATTGEIAGVADQPQLVHPSHPSWQASWHVSESAVASQQKAANAEPAPAQRRGHGGALPR